MTLHILSLIQWQMCCNVCFSHTLKHYAYSKQNNLKLPSELMQKFKNTCQLSSSVQVHTFIQEYVYIHICTCKLHANKYLYVHGQPHLKRILFYRFHLTFYTTMIVVVTEGEPDDTFTLLTWHIFVSRKSR